MTIRYASPIVAVFASASLLAGCSGESAPSRASATPAPPRPVATVTVTATPSPAISASESDEKLSLQVRTVFPSATGVTFDVSVNGKPVGSYNAGGENDLSSFLADGENAVQVSWTADPQMAVGQRAEIHVQQKLPGSEEWTTLISRQVSRETAAGSAEMSVLVGETAPTASSSPALPPGPGLETPSSSTTPLPVTNEAAVKGQYTAKVKQHPYVPVLFTLTLNGKAVGSFSGNADQDITQYVKKGENIGEIAHKVVSDKPVHAVITTNFTLGEKTGEKWSTIVSQDVNERNREGKREFRFQAE